MSISAGRWTKEGYFAPDPEVDRLLKGRTHGMIREIREIASETTHGEAFRKYCLKYLEELERGMDATE